MNLSPANLVELMVAGVLAILGVRSLVRWLTADFDAAATGEQILYLLNVTARVGTWFALAGFFVAVAVVEEPQTLDWYWYVVVGLPAVQLLTGFFLSRAGGDGATPDEGTAGVGAEAPRLAGRRDADGPGEGFPSGVDGRPASRD